MKKAGSGIGRETAFAFAEAGAAAVVFADINLASAQAAAEQSKSFASDPTYEGVAAGVDVGDLSSVAALVKATAERFGRIDYCVNSAGVRSVYPHVDSRNSGVPVKVRLTQALVSPGRCAEIRAVD